jgi:hypothetical protein
LFYHEAMNVVATKDTKFTMGFDHKSPKAGSMRTIVVFVSFVADF